jgi:hypothetical protein
MYLLLGKGTKTGGGFPAGFFFSPYHIETSNWGQTNTIKNHCNLLDDKHL